MATVDGRQAGEPERNTAVEGGKRFDCEFDP